MCGILKIFERQMAATLPSHSLTMKIMDNAFENEYKMTSDTGNEKKRAQRELGLYRSELLFGKKQCFCRGQSSASEIPLRFKKQCFIHCSEQLSAASFGKSSTSQRPELFGGLKQEQEQKGE